MLRIKNFDIYTTLYKYGLNKKIEIKIRSLKDQWLNSKIMKNNEYHLIICILLRYTLLL